MELQNPTAYAKTRGLTKQAVHQAIAAGRVPVYDADGRSIPADTKGRKFVKPDETDAALKANRLRAESDPPPADAVQTPPRQRPGNAKTGKAVVTTLTQARTDRETVRAKRDKLALAREQGELLPRDAVLTAIEQGAGLIAEDLQAFLTMADDLDAASRQGGVDAVRAVIRERVNVIRAGIARRLKSAATTALAARVEDDADAA